MKRARSTFDVLINVRTTYSFMNWDHMKNYNKKEDIVMSKEVITYINENLYGIWFLIGAALVFWMQAGFAMVETGFTRAKNAGNIIMKNLMDFCIGTVTFILIGASLLLGEDFLGFIGKPGLDIFTAYKDFDYSAFVFNLVFCATTATIVSGAMAERTKFLSYCVYSAVISAFIYPIEAHWIWGGGWLSQIGFHDFAGSCAIHMVGGISALIGAKILGPRIGKYSVRTGKPHAIPGHNIPIGALGVFILWLGWYGFNGAAGEIGHLPLVEGETESCNCGKKGCLEQVASATGIVRTANRMLAESDMPSSLRSVPYISAKVIFDEAKGGDALAIQVTEYVCRYLGKGLACAAGMVDPEVFVIGGGVSAAGEYFINLIDKYYKECVFHASRQTKIVKAALGNDAGMYGAAKLILGN